MEWHCKHCGKKLGEFNLVTLIGCILCPRCGVKNVWPKV